MQNNPNRTGRLDFGWEGYCIAEQTLRDDNAYSTPHIMTFSAGGLPVKSPDPLPFLSKCGQTPILVRNASPKCWSYPWSIPWYPSKHQNSCCFSWLIPPIAYGKSKAVNGSWHVSIHCYLISPQNAPNNASIDLPRCCNPGSLQVGFVHPQHRYHGWICGSPHTPKKTFDTT